MRIKNLKNEDFAKLIGSVALRYRVKCDSMNTIIIRQTLQSEFKHYQLNDFNDAFIKHCAGKFMISKDAEGNKPYGDLSAQFVCQVLNSYKQYVAKLNISKPITKPENILEGPKLTKEENASNIYEWLKNHYQTAQRMPLSEHLIDYEAIFWHMNQNDLIDLDNDSKEMFAENVRAELEEIVEAGLTSKVKHYDKTLKVENVLTVRNDIKKLDEAKKLLRNKDLFKKECRKRIVLNHIKNLNQ